MPLDFPILLGAFWPNVPSPSGNTELVTARTIKSWNDSVVELVPGPGDAFLSAYEDF